MFYRLKSNYILRGWNGMPWVLVKRPENAIKNLSQEQFQVLLLCDGETELPGGLLNDSLNETLRECESEGWVGPCEKSVPMDDDQYYRYYSNRYVKMVFWSVTGRCNYRCRHCYVDGPDGKLGEMSTEQAMDLIDQMAGCGVLRVDLTGGELFVRKDLWQLIDRILSYKMTIGQIYTNGWLVNEELIEQFELRGIKPNVQISFDGVGWHDWMRGVSGAEKAALRAFRLLHEHGFKTNAAMCIHRGNLHTLPQTVEALKAVGVDDLKVSTVDMTDLWRCNSQGNEMTREEYTRAMLPYIDWYYKAGRPIKRLEFGGVVELRSDGPAELKVRHYDGTEKCLDCYLCGITRWACYITPEGRLLPCMPMASSPEQNRFPLVQDIGLKQGLSGGYYMRFVNGRIRDLLAANPECSACAYRYKCGGGCRATALLQGNHDLMGCDREMCAFWKNGYEERILQAIQEAEAKYGVSTGA